MGVWYMFLMASLLSLLVNLLAIPMWWYGKAARAKCAQKYAGMAKRQFDVRAGNS